MTPLMIDLDGAGYGPVPVDLEPVRLPARPGVLLDAVPWPDWIPAGSQPVDTAALRAARSAGARVAVACPALASPGQVMLALAVGRLLADERAAAGACLTPLVICPTRPRCAWESGAVIVPHPVTVLTWKSAQLRVVWEVTHQEQIIAWPARLAPVALWPTAVPA
ncbi:hypothetical protein [Pseudofrankia sp. BMG5.37]|uniref:hypothetical protein n=1 Tax=Pseudofrankia sp. BMG5.37 TaxID=3050035 RepID=UPI002893BAE4|nr:hypothetical protein [Pseudofrankia sp. BMG5.37]MDT3443577.1 hypothetical protein [Pseudofrankia sp. BMG5.37]